MNDRILPYRKGCGSRAMVKRSKQRDPLEAVLLAYDQLCTFEFGISIELFGCNRPYIDEWYRLRVARVDPGPLRAAGGIHIDAPYSLRILETAGTIIVPGWRGLDDPVPTALIRALRRAHEEGARILSICSGAFVLAEAGLLDGRRATTHWKYADRLAQRFPNVSVDADVLFVDDDNLITSAGSAAGIDMSLHVIRRDLGVDVAAKVARHLIVTPQRDGGQQQFIETPQAEDPDEVIFSRMLEEVRGDLRGSHTIRTMAEKVHMSERTFARQFKAVTGTTPHRWLQHERVREAQRLLETTSMTMERIADLTGFADAQLLRLHFRRVVGTSPSMYRRNFKSLN